jgi:integrase
MNKKVWRFQYSEEVERKGADNASWYVGWYDHDGKRHAESCGRGAWGKNKAEKRVRRLQAELDMGVHQPPSKKKWSVFREEYEAKILPNLASRSREEVKAALGHFQRLAKPGRMDQIRTQTIDAFVAQRKRERGKNPESSISPATVNKDLRHIRAALRVAHEWGYVPKLPRIRMMREPEKIPRFVTAEHFQTIYDKACPLAVLPQNEGQTYEPVAWWRALIVMAYMTGWRIGELLSLRRTDLDLKMATAITRAADNKGKRDEAVPLHPIVVEHLTRIASDGPLVFPWSKDYAALWEEFGRIQKEAGIRLNCAEQHDHTEACHVYGFHDLRRAFATVNAPRLKPEALQKLMRHKSYSTTLRYINTASQLQTAIATMPVPPGLKPTGGAKADA